MSAVGRLSLADTIGGLTAAMAIAAALNKRPRGQMIDVALLDSLLTTMGWPFPTI